MAAVELAGASENSVAGIVAMVNLYQTGIVQVATRNTLGRAPRWNEPAVFARIRMPITNVAVIPFEIVLEKPGRLLVTAGESKKIMPFSKSAAITRIRMVCSTAHVRFLNVVVTTDSGR